ncbi:MAG: PAS domain S-box protein [Spirochaetia bacterium]|nr:PAS domain S-box protein [Spirochaetia bacterium]
MKQYKIKSKLSSDNHNSKREQYLTEFLKILLDINHLKREKLEKEKFLCRVTGVISASNLYSKTWICLKNEEQNLSPFVCGGFANNKENIIKVKSVCNVSKKECPAVKLQKTKRDVLLDNICFLDKENENILSIAFPLVVNKEFIGVINIYSENENFLDEEIYYLDKLAENISEILEGIETEDRKKAAEIELVDIKNNLEKEVQSRTRQVRESRKHFSELANLLPQSVFEINKNRIFTFVNKHALKSTGYSPRDTFKERDCLNMFVEEQKNDIIRYIDKILNGEKFEPKEFTILKKDGSTFPAVVYASAIKKNAEITGVRGVVVDISEQKKNEESIRKSEERFRILVHSSPYAIVIHDGKNVLYSNEMAVKILKAKNINDLIGGEVISVVHPDSLETVKKRIVLMMREKLPQPLAEEKFIRLDGKVIDVETAAAPVIFDGKPAIQVAFHDITERKQFEKELKEAKITAEGANKMKSIFLANMSHEIRTPLNTILGFAHILHGLEEDKEKRSQLSIINSSGKMLLNLINDILDISKIEAGKLAIVNSSVDIKSIFKEIEAIFSHEIMKKKLKWFLGINSNVPDSFLLDETRFRQVLFNLIGNAVKFTEKGHIKINCSVAPSVENKERYELEISIEDTGIGIPADEQENIFNAFSQQKNQDVKYGGTGLGLTITKRLVNIMGGEIQLQSKKDKGTVFTVILRNLERAVIEKAQSREGYLSKTKDNLDNIKDTVILVVDDVDINRLLIRKYLESPSIKIIEAKNGKEAYELANKIRPDIILMDMKMPVMSGQQAIKKIQGDNNVKHIPIIAVTASVSDETIEELSESRVSYLAKPVSKDALIKEMRKFLKY